MAFIRKFFSSWAAVLLWAMLPLLMIPFFFSCIPQKSLTKQYNLGGKRVELALSMPDNKLVFENLSPMVYEVLWNHFERVGFTLVKGGGGCHTLKVKVVGIDSCKGDGTSYKFLSPDLLTYATKVKIDLLCQLFDKNDHLCVQKVFSFSTLVSKAKEHVANSSFTDFEYRQMLEHEVYKIDHFFRPFLIGYTKGKQTG